MGAIIAKEEERVVAAGLRRRKSMHEEVFVLVRTITTTIILTECQRTALLVHAPPHSVHKLIIISDTSSITVFNHRTIL
jgi:hypothetical protein